MKIELENRTLKKNIIILQSFLEKNDFIKITESVNSESGFFEQEHFKYEGL